MRKLLILVLSTAGSAAGWWLGAFVGTMTAFIVSTIGLGVGIWGGAQLAERWGA
jgi:hypothetical protein